MALTPKDPGVHPVPAGGGDGDEPRGDADFSLDDLVPGGPSVITRLGPIVGLAAAVWWLMRRRRK